MDEDRIADTLNVGDRVECIRDSPDDNDSISVGMQGVVCIIVDTFPHIGVRWDEEVAGGHDCQESCSHGYGWFVAPSDIKRIDDNDELAVDATELDKLFETFAKEVTS